MPIGGLFKPEYLLRPRNIAARLRYRDTSRLPAEMMATVRGRPFRIHPDEVIGRHLLHFGLFDLLVTETLLRLAEPGETAADVGANIGYMSCVLADAVGPAGRVIAFEPHPEIFQDLVWNTRGLPIEARPAATSDHEGTARLKMPVTFAGNRGIATLETTEESHAEIDVALTTLDAAFLAERIGVLKIDIEGHELNALKGATRLLSGRRIRDIVFEEHNPVGSPVAKYLAGFGYRVFRLHKTFRGPELIDADARIAESTWESPSLLATLEPDRARRLLSRGGWHALRN